MEPPNGQGLAAASRPRGTASKVESSVKIAGILAQSGRLQPVVGLRQRALLHWNAENCAISRAEPVVAVCAALICGDNRSYRPIRHKMAIRQILPILKSFWEWPA
jgi:hypothetical protein